jgi:hypothetical protein
MDCILEMSLKYFEVGELSQSVKAFTFEKKCCILLRHNFGDQWFVLGYCNNPKLRVDPADDIYGFHPELYARNWE